MNNIVWLVKCKINIYRKKSEIMHIGINTIISLSTCKVAVDYVYKYIIKANIDIQLYIKHGIYP